MQTSSSFETYKSGFAPAFACGIDRPAPARVMRRVPTPAPRTSERSRATPGLAMAIAVAWAVLGAGRPVPEAVLGALGVLLGAWLIARAARQLPVAQTPAAAAMPEGPAPAPADMWRIYPSGTDSKAPARIALIAPDGAHGRAIATHLSKLGPEVHHCTDGDALLASIEARPTRWTAVLVDLDAAADAQALRGDLAEFSAACPEIQVSVLSGGVLRRQPLRHARFASGRQGSAPMILPNEVARALLDGDGDLSAP